MIKVDIRKPIITGIMGLTAIGVCKAQKPVEVFSETGLTGVVHKEAVYYGGMNLGIPTEKNYTDVFAGMTINSDKKASFLALAKSSTLLMSNKSGLSKLIRSFCSSLP